MNENNVYGHDLEFFNKLKREALEAGFVYDLATFQEDVRRFHEKIKEAYHIHDLIETRIHINTDPNHFGDINEGFGDSEHPFWSWEHVKDDLVKAYHATERHKAK